ncbi:unnamed protein product [Caretta caretta]
MPKQKVNVAGQGAEKSLYCETSRHQQQSTWNPGIQPQTLGLIYISAKNSERQMKSMAVECCIIVAHPDEHPMVSTLHSIHDRLNPFTFAICELRPTETLLPGRTQEEQLIQTGLSMTVVNLE